MAGALDHRARVAVVAAAHVVVLRVEPRPPLGYRTRPPRAVGEGEHQAPQVGHVGLVAVAVAHEGHGDVGTVLVDLEAVLIEMQGQALHVGAGVGADPAMAVRVVGPQVVHEMAIGFDEAVLAAPAQEGGLEVGGVGHPGRPRPAPRRAPLGVRCRRAEVEPGVVAEGTDALDVGAGLRRQACQRPVGAGLARTHAGRGRDQKHERPHRMQ